MFSVLHLILLRMFSVLHLMLLQMFSILHLILLPMFSVLHLFRSHAAHIQSGRTAHRQAYRLVMYSVRYLIRIWYASLHNWHEHTVCWPWENTPHRFHLLWFRESLGNFSAKKKGGGGDFWIVLETESNVWNVWRIFCMLLILFYEMMEHISWKARITWLQCTLVMCNDMDEYHNAVRGLPKIVEIPGYVNGIYQGM